MLNNQEMDIEFSLENKVIVGKRNKPLSQIKADLIKKLQQLEQKAKQEIRSVSTSYTGKFRKLKLIASQDDIKRASSTIESEQSMHNSNIKRYISEKEKEIKLLN